MTAVSDNILQILFGINMSNVSERKITPQITNNTLYSSFIRIKFKKVHLVDFIIQFITMHGQYNTKLIQFNSLFYQGVFTVVKGSRVLCIKH
jgi:hypothetical protein